MTTTIHTEIARPTEVVGCEEDGGVGSETTGWLSITATVKANPAAKVISPIPVQVKTPIRITGGDGGRGKAADGRRGWSATMAAAAADDALEDRVQSHADALRSEIGRLHEAVSSLDGISVTRHDEVMTRMDKLTEMMKKLHELRAKRKRAHRPDDLVLVGTDDDSCSDADSGGDDGGYTSDHRRPRPARVRRRKDRGGGGSTGELVAMVAGLAAEFRAFKEETEKRHSGQALVAEHGSALDNGGVDIKDALDAIKSRLDEVWFKADEALHMTKQTRDNADNNIHHLEQEMKKESAVLRERVGRIGEEAAAAAAAAASRPGFVARGHGGDDLSPVKQLELLVKVNAEMVRQNNTMEERIQRLSAAKQAELKEKDASKFNRFQKAYAWYKEHFQAAVRAMDRLLESVERNRHKGDTQLLRVPKSKFMKFEAYEKAFSEAGEYLTQVLNDLLKEDEVWNVSMPMAYHMTCNGESLPWQTKLWLEKGRDPEEPDKFVWTNRRVLCQLPDLIKAATQVHAATIGGSASDGLRERTQRAQMAAGVVIGPSSGVSQVFAKGLRINSRFEVAIIEGNFVGIGVKTPKKPPGEPQRQMRVPAPISALAGGDDDTPRRPVDIRPGPADPAGVFRFPNPSNLPIRINPHPHPNNDNVLPPDLMTVINETPAGPEGPLTYDPRTFPRDPGLERTAMLLVKTGLGLIAVILSVYIATETAAAFGSLSEAIATLSNVVVISLVEISRTAVGGLGELTRSVRDLILTTLFMIATLSSVMYAITRSGRRRPLPDAPKGDDADEYDSNHVHDPWVRGRRAEPPRFEVIESDDDEAGGGGAAPEEEAGDDDDDDDDDGGWWGLGSGDGGAAPDDEEVAGDDGGGGWGLGSGGDDDGSDTDDYGDDTDGLHAPRPRRRAAAISRLSSVLGLMNGGYGYKNMTREDRRAAATALFDND